MRQPRRMPTNPRSRELKARGCARNVCWKHSSFTDGGVKAVLGNGWWAFMADNHFSDANGCLAANDERRGSCDAIAVFAQRSNRDLRVIEVKTPIDFAEAKPSLRAGVELAVSLPRDTFGAIRVELHVADAPSTSVRPRRERRTLIVDGVAYPISVFVAGNQRM